LKRILLDKQEGVDRLCNDIPVNAVIALDTEFARRDTYFAILSLVQLAFDGKIYIVDAMRTDVKALWTQIVKSNSTVIIHSGRQDLEIFYQLFKILPTNIMDVQIAAKLCGFRAYISYGELCHNICDAVIDKKHQAANWLAREISEEMLDYAALDVSYLEQIYNHLQKIIDKKNLNTEFKNEVSKTLLDPVIYKNNPDNAWKKVKFSNRKEGFIKKIQILAAFREESAVNLDIPRGFFASDKHLIQICNMLPTSMNMLKQIPNLRQWIKRPEYSEKLFDLCSGIRDEGDAGTT
jgi:ribonuclease D